MSIERFMSQVYYNRGCFALSGLLADSRVLPYLCSSAVVACTGRQMWAAFSSLLCDEMNTSVVGLVAAYDSSQFPVYRTMLWLIPMQGKYTNSTHNLPRLRRLIHRLFSLSFSIRNPDCRLVAWCLP